MVNLRTTEKLEGSAEDNLELLEPEPRLEVDDDGHEVQRVDIEDIACPGAKRPAAPNGAVAVEDRWTLWQTHELPSVQLLPSQGTLSSQRCKTRAFIDTSFTFEGDAAESGGADCTKRPERLNPLQARRSARVASALWR